MSRRRGGGGESRGAVGRVGAVVVDMLVAVQLVKEDYQHQSEDEVFCENERIHSNSNSDVRHFFLTEISFIFQ